MPNKLIPPFEKGSGDYIELAIGYPVEFDHYQEIIARYGGSGITNYELEGSIAEISDDTQMTLFTANGMLMGLTRGFMRGIGNTPEYYVEYAYQDWYNTQMKSYEEVMSHDDKHFSHRCTWLSAIPELYSRRAQIRGGIARLISCQRSWSVAVPCSDG